MKMRADCQCNIQLIACDLDGTLLNDEMKISQENLRAMKWLTERDVCVVPATGRTLSEMSEVADNPDVRYLIYSNGAVVLDKKTQQKIQMCLSKELSNFILDTIRLYDVYVIMHYNGQTYASPVTPETIPKYHLNSTVCSLVQKCANIEENYVKLAYSMDQVESIVVHFTNDQDKEECKQKLLSNQHLYLAEVTPCSFEVFSIRAGKDKALVQLVNQLHLDADNVMTIGDSGNDIAMTQVAGLGLATSNGSELIKAVADRVICSNQEHVLDYVVKNYFDAID